MVVSASSTAAPAGLHSARGCHQSSDLNHAKQNARVAALRKAFKRVFNDEADFVVRAPGRVNIIGEHIDYCGYGVFPMAVEQDILVAAKKTTSNTIELRNVEVRYPKYSCPLSAISINSSSPQWFDYFLCGVKAIQERFSGTSLPGMHLLVEGCIPPAAGMSSSSALVCSAALAAMNAIGEDLPRDELASLCAKCERYVGVQGGGMDQAICLLAEEGAAKLIQFEPALTAQTVQLPPAAVFVVANSCVEINKGNTSYYNTRVVECRLAAQLILEKNGKEWRKPVRLSHVQKCLKLSLEKAAELVKSTLHAHPYSLAELCEVFGMSTEEFVSWALSEKTKNITSFDLHNRALHVFQEARRVYQFKAACETGDINRMGELMMQSHASCRDLYECSHPLVDQLVELCCQNGALGSRLTGAGWGGCSVTLTVASKVSSIVAALEKGFYGPRGLTTAGNVFVSTPADRGRIFA
ncbi:N-acetylgalactosamine kinase-like [Tropilaelaps mercedesae]|uniref:N-acetylgalactosamine kinase-like n=1 Tax=Tropilaelaps mercedesae TaxID=418985 RepID=A0A1V9WZH1_9ACAR|nr:N-acetylgalactosamine kinase-like [Tropilaelaps mercedesae]